jgi:ATP-dependent Clp protease ATP-binding subunit ClpA
MLCLSLAPNAPQGRTVSFRNAVIIMTSNLGSADILAASRSAAAGGGADEAFSLLTRDRVMAQVGIWRSASCSVTGAS